MSDDPAVRTENQHGRLGCVRAFAGFLFPALLDWLADERDICDLRSMRVQDPVIYSRQNLKAI
jgi:hypothetical protein